jgi:hypothetical protein
VAISDPVTAHFTAIKNLGNTRIAYKPRHTHTHTHLETLEARFVCNSCVSQVLIAVKCAVAGSLIATGV